MMVVGVLMVHQRARFSGAKGPCKNKFGDYGAGILAAGEARATSIPRQWVCKERTTKLADKRPSQNCRSYFCTVPNGDAFRKLKLGQESMGGFNPVGVCRDWEDYPGQLACSQPRAE